MSKVKQVEFDFSDGRSKYNGRGEEILDPRPVEVPVGFERPETLSDILARLLRPEVQEELRNRAGLESFEDANDFEVEDDAPIEAPWQDPEYGPGMTREQEIRAGQVAEPDWDAARLLRERAQAVLDRYDENGKLKPVTGKEGA